MIFIVAVITVFAAAQDSYIGRQCGRLIYTPAQDAMVWHKTTFHAGLNDTTRYTWVPSSEVEGAWDEILSAINVRVDKDWFTRMVRNTSRAVQINDGKGGYAGMLDVFHHLRCLQPAQDNDAGPGAEDANSNTSEWHAKRIATVVVLAIAGAVDLVSRTVQVVKKHLIAHDELQTFNLSLTPTTSSSSTKKAASVVQQESFDELNGSEGYITGLGLTRPAVQQEEAAVPGGIGFRTAQRVGPDFAKFYANKETFSCISHPSIVLQLSQVNDNSCDCPDGSDEPGTAHCAHLDALSPPQPLAGSPIGTTNTSTALPGFWCANEGHIGAYVPFRIVNDGVCDYELCCDGSEEYAHVGGVKCEDRCAAVGKKHRRMEDEKRKAMERAIKKRRTMVKEAREKRRLLEAKISVLKGEVEATETKRDELQKKLVEVEKSEKGKVVRPESQGGKLGILLGLAKKRVEELRETLDKVLEQRDGLQEKVDELESILRKFKEEYNPNFNDEGVKAAVKSWEDYAAKQPEEKETISESEIDDVVKADSETSGINWMEFEEDEVTEADILYNLEAYLPGFVRDYIHGKLNLLRIWLIENGMLADKPTSTGESRLVAAAREALETASSDLVAKGNDVRDLEGDLQKDYGVDDIFRALKDKCVSAEVGEYEYELCWLDKTTQKNKKGYSQTGMGNFIRIDTETADDEDRADHKSLGKGRRTVLRYDHGQHCWNGPNRRTDVWLACAETEEIWRVVEQEKCVYKMEVGTPAACEDVQEPTLPRKEEL
ncbi:hypothetical protein P8C59_008982 [Phyllachora maydis]|uniref:Glucosidase 2 subunit beta n=1 Tax=Phyllachora maydis TaxID=1825666 RepID=A0AAD9MF54_9PEZI|nr:hypothetical protein P8C59_008982 [Phyllachora maydis]